MFNIPDDCIDHPSAPWNEVEWRCPECGGHQDDVDCQPDHCVDSEREE